MKDSNPVSILLFYFPAIIFTMIFMDGYFIMTSFVLAAGNYLVLKGLQGVKTVLGLGAFALLLSGINLILNRQITYIYGLCLGFLFSAVLLWFFSMNLLMDMTKIKYLTKNTSPRFSMLVSLIFRLIPMLKKRIGEIIVAKSLNIKKDSIKNSAETVNTLVSWTMEDGIGLGENMEARGFTGRNATGFTTIEFKLSDFICIIMNICFSIIIITGYAMDKKTISLIVLGVFLAEPVAIYILKEIRWNISKSRI